VEFINKYLPEIFSLSVLGTVETLTIHSNFLNSYGTDLLNRKSCGDLQEEEGKKKNRFTEKKYDGGAKDLNYKLSKNIKAHTDKEKLICI